MYNPHKTPSSYTYDVHEQDQAIRSAETQVSIANDTLKQATANLTDRADALSVAVSNYFSHLSGLRAVDSSESAASRIAAPADSMASRSVSSGSAPVRSSDSSAAKSASSATGSGASMSNLLVSLRSGAGVIYSLVNRKR